MVFLTLFIFPLIIAGLAFIIGKRNVTKEEFFLQLAIQFLIVSVSILLIYSYNTYDNEIWNGSVVEKKREEVSCEHSYQCMCVTMSCGEDCTTTVCQTCYEHSYDVDWNVYSNIRNWTIQRLDSRGLKEPPRWSKVKVGDPVVDIRGFENYIKAAPGTLFKYQGLIEKYVKALPNYPYNVYDYYYLDRLIQVGVSVPDLKQWNSDLMLLNAKVGYSKGANMIVVLTSGQPREYFYALSQHWLGGKKNDIVSVIDISQSGDINWAEIMAWTDDEIFRVKLRDDLLDLKVLDRAQVIKIIESNVLQYYKRKSMEDFSYLKNSVVPTTGQWITAMVVGLLSSIGIAVYFYNNEEKESKYGNYK